MPGETAAGLADELDALASEVSSLAGADGERRVLSVLERVFVGEGYTSVALEASAGRGAIDLIAERPVGDEQFRVAIEYKGARIRTGVEAVRAALAAAMQAGVDRLMLISRSGFSSDALEEMAQDRPLEIELLDRAGLRSWATRLRGSISTAQSQVVVLITGLSKALARLVANDPRALDALEWRDLERMMREVLEGLGFEAELTPASKDGGKDVIVRLVDGSGRQRSFIVELKHWRSGHHVGHGKLTDFVQVVAREGHEKGLFLATYGYAADAISALTEVERQRVSIGEEPKIVSLCKTFVKAEQGLWTPDADSLPEVLFADTV